MVSVQQIPEAAYGGIVIDKSAIHIACITDNNNNSFTVHIADNALSTILSSLKNYADEHNLKYISIGVCGHHVDLELFSKLWLALDIVPLEFEPTENDPAASAFQAARYVRSHFDKHNSFAAVVGSENKVETPPLVSLEEYQLITPPEQYERLTTLAAKIADKKITYFSATPQGGGVAIMRHALLRLFDLLDVNATWHVLEPEAQIFDITKQKFHNVLQSVNKEGTLLTDADKQLFHEWSNRNATLFEPVIKRSDLIVIDDPQPAGLVPHIKRINPSTKVVYRSHIQLLADLANAEGTPQHVTWDFVWNNIQPCDLFIAHPIPEFVPKEIPSDKLRYMPPSTDPLDGLNKELSDEQKNYYMTVFNNILSSQDQVPLDPNRPYIVQIARFDPSKGIPDVVEAYVKLRKLLFHHEVAPQLAIVGNSSVDDPDGKPIFEHTMQLINEKYHEYQEDIKVVRAPHYDQLLNALLRKASIAVQLSHKEGFEFKVTEAVMKGIPTIIYDVGGMPLQVQHNVTGFVVEKGNTDQVAQHMYDLLSNQELYRTMSLAAAKGYMYEATTVPNAIKWLEIANELID